MVSVMAAVLSQAQTDLAPYAARLEGCVRKALDEYVKGYKKLRRRHSKRTQASIIQDLMVAAAEDEFGSAERGVAKDVAVYTKGNLRFIAVNGGLYKIKLKKLDQHRAASNIPTQAALSFCQQMCFDSIPSSTNLHLGYQVLNDAALTESKVWIACPTGSAVGWEWELVEADTSTRAVTEVVPIKPARSAVPERKRSGRVKVKPEVAKKLDKKNNGTAGKSR